MDHESSIEDSMSESVYKLKYNFNKSTHENFKMTAYMESTYNQQLIDSNSANEINKNSESEERKFIIQRTGLIEIWNQTSTLLWKNYVYYKRNYKFLIFQALTPILALLVILMLQAIMDYYSGQFMIENPKESLINSSIVNCKKYKGHPDCVTIGYGIIYNQSQPQDLIIYDEIMKEVANSNGLEFNKDVKLLTQGKNSTSFSDYLSANKNKTSFGILFCYDLLTYQNTTIPCKSEFLETEFITYNLVYNTSLSINDFLGSFKLPFRKDTNLLKLKLDIDNAILKVKGKSKKSNSDKLNEESQPPKITMSISDFPSTRNRITENADIISSYGPFYFFFVCIINFVFVLLDIVKEKELKLRKSLIVIGLKPISYWLSWIITSLFFACITPIILIAFGCLMRFKFFTNSNLFVIWLIFFVFILSLQFMAFFLSTVISSMDLGYTVSYSFVIIGLIIEALLSNQGLIQLLYVDDVSTIVWWVRNILLIYPPFSFAKLMLQINTKASYVFNANEGKWTLGPGFFLKDLFESQKGSALNINFTVPPPSTSLWVLCANILIFWILCFYFDHVLESNQGKNYDYVFFLRPSFWCGKLFQSKVDQDKIRGSDVAEEEKSKEEIEKGIKKQKALRSNKHTINGLMDCSVVEEKNKVLETNSDDSKKGVIILGLSKTYDLAVGCLGCGSKQIKALKPTFMEISPNEIFSIIGHNGAGKTTLINMLTGNIMPTEGTARIYGKDILTESAESYVGLCPQHDILWEDLTAEEHLKIYCQLRCINPLLVDEAIEKYLKEVNLHNQKKNEVKKYSGGMKRRLSIILSTVGDPKVIFLDEPTTGLDPVNKRFIWKMVQNIKQGRSIILTTHAMEEAEFLSDRIGVIKNGEFKSIGTSLQLKEIYGAGYLLTFVVNSTQIKEALEELKIHIPSGKVIGTQGGSIIMNLDVEKSSEMKTFVNILNRKSTETLNISKLLEYVKECGMDFTTLEEIFIKVTL